jgi:hypothetical protein
LGFFEASNELGGIRIDFANGKDDSTVKMKALDDAGGWEMEEFKADCSLIHHGESVGGRACRHPFLSFMLRAAPLTARRTDFRFIQETRENAPPLIVSARSLVWRRRIHGGPSSTIGGRDSKVIPAMVGPMRASLMRQAR